MSICGPWCIACVKRIRGCLGATTSFLIDRLALFRRRCRHLADRELRLPDHRGLRLRHLRSRRRRIVERHRQTEHLHDRFSVAVLPSGLGNVPSPSTSTSLRLSF